MNIGISEDQLEKIVKRFLMSYLLSHPKDEKPYMWSLESHIKKFIKETQPIQQDSYPH